MSHDLAVLANGLIDYLSLQPEQLQPAFLSLRDANIASLEQIIENSGQTPGWDTFVLAIEQLDQTLEDLFHALVPLVYESEEWAVEIDACNQLLLDWARHKHEHSGLYEAYQRLDMAELDTDRQVVLKQILRDFRFSGYGLASNEIQQLRTTEQAIAGLEQQFMNNLSESRKAWTCLLVDEASLAGLPALERDRLHAKAQARGQPGWLVDLEESTVEVILEWADERELREKVYQASRCLASDLGTDIAQDNAPVLQALLRLRHERAQLLGFANAVELGLEVKDVRTTAQVESFISALIDHNRPRLQEDLEALQGLGDKLGIEQVAPWDVAYLGRRLRLQGNEALEASMRERFPLDASLQGLWQLHERLLGIRIAPCSVAGWHSDVQVLEVSDGETPLGHIYLDAYARPGKMPWPYSYPMRLRHVHADGSVTLPVALLSCCFERVPGQSSPNLSHEDLCKLFHEAGHAVHLLLVTNQHRRLNRTATAALGPDTCEFVGILLEQWCWSAPTLLALSQRTSSAAPLSLPQMQQWLAGKRRFQAVKEAEQLRMCWFDFIAHRDHRARQDLRRLAISATQQVGLGEAFMQDRFAEGFDYMVTGYEAGYYCYKWAQVHATDAFSAFEETDADDQMLGRRLRNEILAWGGLRRMTASFEAFAGRPVSFEAYTRRRLSA
ncbi:M3 family metallopeptidase [Pseudomonas putida]|uniref:M3 family metallopeptidase n=1 Tax=Pseudomonas putida TaxID=303 RepID=UPI00300F7B9C